MPTSVPTRQPSFCAAGAECSVDSTKPNRTNFKYTEQGPWLDKLLYIYLKIVIEKEINWSYPVSYKQFIILNYYV